MIKGTDNPEGLDLVVKGPQTIVTRTFVRFGVHAVALSVRADSCRSIQRRECPLRIRQYLMLHRNSDNRARIEVVQITEGGTAAAIGSSESCAVGADHNSVIRSRALRGRALRGREGLGEPTGRQHN